MIIVKNRELLIPNNERYIGTTYDNETENRVFQVPRFSQRGVDLAALTFRLDIQYANEAFDTVLLDKEVGEAFIILIWRITSSTLQVPGTLYIGLRAIDDEATVKWSSFSAAMYAERHLNTPGNYGGSLTEIEQMEQDHVYMKGVVDELKANIDYAHDAEAWAKGTRSGSAVPSTDETYHKNSKYYSDQASTKATQAANSATAAANSATQAAETVSDTNTRFNNAMAAVTSETEVIDARVGADGTQYTVLKNRLDAEHNQLKNAIRFVRDGEIVYPSGDIIQGTFYNTDGSVQNSPNRVRTKGLIEVHAGEKITITPGTVASMYVIATYTIAGTYVGETSFQTAETTLTLETDRKLIFIFRNTAGTEITPSQYDANIKFYTEVNEKIAELQQNIESVANEFDSCFDTSEVIPDNLLDPSEVGMGYYWTNGYNSSNSYVHSGLIPVTAGKTYSLQTGAKTTTVGRALRSMRFIVFYKSNGNIDSTLASLSSFTVPSTATGVRVSVNSNSVADFLARLPAIVEGTTLIDYAEYFAPYTQNILKSEYNNDEHIMEVVAEVIESARHTQNGLVVEFDMSSNNHGTTEELNDMFGYSIQFRGAVTTFNGIIIGHGYGQAYGGHVRVTPTNFEYYMGTESAPRLSEAHGLTITDYIAIRIDAKENMRADFTVCTNGGIYTKANQTWDVRKGQLSARSDGTNVLTGCVLSYNCKGWGKPIQLYGDSYFGTYSSKWTQYLVNAGFMDNLQNGYPGRQSAMALLVAKTVLANSNPEKVVWCLGMNDGDDDGAVDASWKSCIEELEQICADRNIELILATIPNVPTVDNTAKNAYVRASGHRYIDFASAVGASSGTTWYSGMLSSDGVHPAEPGAIALFNQAIADVPELMQ